MPVVDFRPFKAPDFKATTAPSIARVAGRANAARISEEEEEELLAERKELLEREFSGRLTRLEKARLTYVRWSLDRIEDARSGWALDELEAAVAQYEHFNENINSLIAQLNFHAGLKK
jgi:hypothetical protein